MFKFQVSAEKRKAGKGWKYLACVCLLIGWVDSATIFSHIYVVYLGEVCVFRFVYAYDGEHINHIQIAESNTNSLNSDNT